MDEENYQYNVEEVFPFIFREFIKSTHIDFPDERLGVADKSILRKVVYDELCYFKDNYPHLSPRSTLFGVMVRKGMEKYGYKVLYEDSF